MPCFRPLDAAWIPGSGQKPLIYGKGQRPPKLTNGYKAIDLPCGQCAGCRLSKSGQWATRLMHEAAYYEERYGIYSTFITLTYDDDHLPYGGTLLKEDVQKFLKRLRWNVAPHKLRYYVSGEYGSTCPDHELENCPKCGPIQRPHYHGIILGYSFPDKQVIGSRDGELVYESDLLADSWSDSSGPIGSHEIGSCTFESCAYVARYIMKKITGEPAHEHYKRYLPLSDVWTDVEPEFSMMSTGRKTGEGIGGPWLMKYMDDVYPSDEVPVPGRGVSGTPPRYYDKMYEKIERQRTRPNQRAAHGRG